MRGNILVVEDDPFFQEMFADFLTSAGYGVQHAANYDEAMARFAAGCDLVVADIVLGGRTGIDLLRDIHDIDRRCPVLVITGHPTFETAVKAVRFGAYEYLAKPVSKEALLEAVARGLQRLGERRSDWRVMKTTRSATDTAPSLSPRITVAASKLVGSSLPLQRILDLIPRLADLDSSVLITGESGTGKEMAAEAIHALGVRSSRPLVKVNCSALPENLLESELFGHVRGAFTGACKDKIGRFQRANGGTIFLDEIGDISPRLQLALLRVLQHKEFDRVGDARPIRVDARVIAATNQDLLKQVRRGKFREDLYYRLRVVELNMPPLRERREDIPLLVDHFLQRRDADGITKLSPAVAELFQSYAWPGNVRELEHALEHARVHARGRMLEVADLPVEIARRTQRSTLADREPHSLSSEQIVEMLTRTGGNKAKAARLLGIDRSTLYRKMAEHGMSGLEI